LVSETPGHFRFTAKFPKVITHDKHLKNITKESEYFHQAMLPLKDKTLAFDNESKAFVIIEYKKDRNFSVVDQVIASAQ
jgi:hypothetical protein